MTVISSADNPRAQRAEAIVLTQLQAAMNINMDADVHPANTCLCFLQLAARVLAGVDRAATADLMRAYADALEQDSDGGPALARFTDAATRLIASTNQFVLARTPAAGTA